MKQLFLVILTTMSVSLFAEVDCEADQPWSSRTTAQVLVVKCGDKNQVVNLRSRETVTHATVRGTDAQGQEYTARIPMTCAGRPCTLAQVYNREFDKIAALHTFQLSNTNGAVPPITHFQVDRVAFADSVRPVRDIANLNPTGATLGETAGGLRATPIELDGVNLPDRKARSWEAAASTASVVAAPVPLRPSISAPETKAERTIVQPPASSNSVIAAVVDGESRPYTSCNYVSIKNYNKVTNEDVKLIPASTTSTSFTCDIRNVCLARTSCMVGGRRQVGMAFCLAKPNGSCPAADACANSSDINSSEAEDSSRPSTVPSVPSNAREG